MEESNKRRKNERIRRIEQLSKIACSSVGFVRHTNQATSQPAICNHCICINKIKTYLELVSHCQPMCILCIHFSLSLSHYFSINFAQFFAQRIARHQSGLQILSCSLFLVLSPTSISSKRNRCRSNHLLFCSLVVVIVINHRTSILIKLTIVHSPSPSIGQF